MGHIRSILMGGYVGSWILGLCLFESCCGVSHSQTRPISPGIDSCLSLCGCNSETATTVKVSTPRNRSTSESLRTRGGERPNLNYRVSCLLLGRIGVKECHIDGPAGIL